MPEFAIRLAESLVSVCDPIAVLLFGSWAKGTASVTSDVDLVVIVPQRPSPPLLSALRDTVLRLPMHVDLLVWTPADVAAGYADPNGFPGSVLSQSVVLHGVLPAPPAQS
jgi:predicted nucleotidyltransferase